MTKDSDCTAVKSPNGPQTDIQKESVRRLIVEARSKPDWSRPCK